MPTRPYTHEALQALFPKIVTPETMSQTVGSLRPLVQGFTGAPELSQKLTWPPLS